MNEAKINIAVTDDHMLFRKGLCALLSDFDFVGEIYEAGNGVELLDLLKEKYMDVNLVLLDINMPKMDGIETTKQLKIRYPNVNIIILSMEDDVSMVSNLVNEGVNGYLLKNADPDELELALKKVVKNDFYFSGSLSNAVLVGIKDITRSYDTSLKIKLTEREKEIIGLICEELTASQIAEKLALSKRTVEGHKKNLLEKTGTKNMAGLVVFAIKNNLYKI